MNKIDNLCYKLIQNQIERERHEPLMILEKINSDYKHVISSVTRPIIQLHYGPYKCNHILKHRMQKLYGLLERLITLNYEILLFESPHLNRLVVEMLGYEIARINITNLKFNHHCEDDPTCMLIIEKIVKATKRLMSRKNVTTNLDYVFVDSYLNLDCNSSILLEY